METVSEIKLDEKEFGFCFIPMNEIGDNPETIPLEDNEMGVYIPKLLGTIPAEKPFIKEVTVDYSIIKNKKYNTKKTVNVCNYILSKPYKENNISAPLFTKGERCFIRFLYTDIKQPFFLSENELDSGVRQSDRKVISAIDGGAGSYGLTLDTYNGYVELNGDTNQYGTYKHSIKIDQKNDNISLDSGASGIILSPDGVSLQSAGSTRGRSAGEGSNLTVNSNMINITIGDSGFEVANGAVSITGETCDINSNVNINGVALNDYISQEVDKILDEKGLSNSDLDNRIRSIVNSMIGGNK